MRGFCTEDLAAVVKVDIEDPSSFFYQLDTVYLLMNMKRSPL